MKRIIPRIIVMLTGLLVFAIGIIYNFPVAMGAGILVSIFALISTIEAELYNRSRWDRLIRYYLKEKDKSTESDMRVVLTEYEIEELRQKLSAAEEKPSMIYVGGFKPMVDALNRVHSARSGLKSMTDAVQTIGSIMEVAGREVNE